ncbi:alanine aminotransferase 2-like [Leguminivora glycinivorella]|uniref:alanine aminotransferase 2-like n=1 Tax=Leguminivora glycinivorella TaxID=1035111 RepID=UPI00200FD5C8|nr:alanine aminotransferase 2-like [Leguminivora glycinivorella]
MKLESTTECVNQNLLNIQYAVRGPIVARAAQIEKELEKGVKKPFDRVVRANIGDCHALGQAPFTFIRQVQALVACPQLLSSPDIPDDVKARAKELLADCTKGSVGAYSPSQGLLVVRRRAAQYLSTRDGVPAYPEQIYLGSGASDLIKAVLSLFGGDVDGKPSSVMIPIPQYPVFSGTLSELGIGQAHYYLDEAHGWALMADELERSWMEASETSAVRALVVINPGNPTGQVLTRENMEEIIKFAHRRRLFLLADEVYQENIVSKPFLSFKKVMHEMGAPYSSMELASFITASKGWAAECGTRAGLAEIPRLSETARKAFEASRAVAQCPNLLGQVALDCVMEPPAPGEPSYEQFVRELATVRRTLCERTATAYQKLNAIPTFSCNPIDASMFAFPKFSVPARATTAARAHEMKPDEFYCLRLLEETGVCVVPGSGFGQAEGTLHFRTTILHPREEFSYMMEQIANFHVKFLKEYEDERSEG